MARRDVDEVTPELTGADASACEANRGDAGDGGSRWGADMTGCEGAPNNDEPGYELEADPSEPFDITPDTLVRGVSDGLSDDDRRLTARPDEELRPITPDLLPSDDPGAARGDPVAEERARRMSDDVER